MSTPSSDNQVAPTEPTPRGAVTELIAAVLARDHARLATLAWAARMASSAQRGFFLELAASAGDAAALRILLSHCDARGVSPHTPLIGAAKAGHEECVALLLPSADAKEKDWQGRTALMIAARAGHAGVVRLLLDHSDPKSQDNKNRTALMLAACSGHTECVRLLDSVSDHSVISAVSISARTALMEAAVSGHADCVRLLLAHSDPLATNLFGQTALMLAAKFGRVDCVRILAPVSNVDARSTNGKSAISLAVAAQHYECADLLAERADRRSANRALKKLGRERMPRWAAQLEGLAIERAMRAAIRKSTVGRLSIAGAQAQGAAQSAGSATATPPGVAPTKPAGAVAAAAIAPRRARRL